MRKSQIDKSRLLFSDRDLITLLVPLMAEQLLSSLMGSVDTIMVSNVGSAAISAVSLVDSINVLFIQVFAALAAGGTIICSQYLGKKEPKECQRAAEQVFLSMAVISVAITVLCVAFRYPLLSLIFGEVEQAVMDDAQIYFLITALSYPFIALFNANAAFFRAEGNSRLPMLVSLICNFVNIGGNTLFIFGMHMGTAGAALSTLLSRIVMAAILIWRQRQKRQTIVIRHYLRLRPDFALIAVVLSVGIPSGIENGMFQFGKLAIQSTVSTMGTAAIAAQAMAIILENLEGIAAIGIGIGLMTIVGQCVGAGERDQAVYYIKKLCGWSEIAILIGTVLLTVLTRPICAIAGMEAQSTELCMQMMLAILLVKPVVWVFAFIPGYGLRAAGDVKFSMITSTCTMWLFRVSLCIYLARVQGMGPMAVWIGMFADWTARGVIFGMRFRSRKWLRHHIV